MPNGISGKKKKRAVIALVIALCMCFVSMVALLLCRAIGETPQQRPITSQRLNWPL